MSFRVLIFTFILISFFTSYLEARKPEPFLNSTLDAANKEGRYVLLHFFADWCPSCRAQKKILDKIMVEDQDLKKVVALVIPYDDALKLRKDYNVNRQSTLIVLKSGKELAREAGQTEKDKVLSFLKTHVASD